MVNKPLCSALTSAGITDPDSQEGIDFCTDQCPYERCVAVEKRGLRRHELRAAERRRRALEMSGQGYTSQEIADRLEISIWTVQRYLRRTK